MNTEEPGLAYFSSEHYQTHNRARLEHLVSLGLPLAGRVLELGSGPGDHTAFYIERGCSVVATDARDECLAELRTRFPQVEVRRMDLNQPEELRELGLFDIVHCYGLLYHLESPEPVIAEVSGICRRLLLLERPAFLPNLDTSSSM
jgi:2-polyprenyl-3-methyl-5-hydroxy-6-metoxy-1,4-benzoquinol methylase